jgi:hypothetical protein
MEWAERMARKESRWQAIPQGSWAAATDRFFRGLATLDVALADTPSDLHRHAIIFQGPIADALTHVGQLTMMRGMVGASVRPERYARAKVRAGRVGVDQDPERTEFDGDASSPAKP